MKGLILFFRQALGLLTLIVAFNATEVVAAKKPIDPAELEKIKAANGQCLDCHSEEGFASGRHPEFSRQAIEEHFVDPDTFEASNHGHVECVACHVTGFTKFPHLEPPSTATNFCDECHTRIFLRIEDQFLKSVHAQDLSEKFTCTTCHDPHVFRQETHFSQVREAVAQDNGMCLGCHEDPEKFAIYSLEEPPDLAEIHDWLPNIRTHWDSVRCVECHTPEPGKVVSHEILAANRAERDCVACHSVESSLRVRLYRHRVAEEREKAGFLNSVIMNEAYVIGATRNRYLDLASFILSGVVVAGIALHGLGRLVAAWVRRRRSRG